MEVRPSREADWEELRALRLRALADTPEAFESTLDRERAFPEPVWRQRAGDGPAQVNFIAWEDGAALGMVAVLIQPGPPPDSHLVGMWVDPRYRRRGIARTLIGHAMDWARRRQARELSLWVLDGNIAARTLYERIGFAPTGRRQPLQSDPARMESLLRVPLDGHAPEAMGDREVVRDLGER